MSCYQYEKVSLPILHCGYGQLTASILAPIITVLCAEHVYTQNYYAIVFLHSWGLKGLLMKYK